MNSETNNFFDDFSASSSNNKITISSCAVHLVVPVSAWGNSIEIQTLETATSNFLSRILRKINQSSKPVEITSDVRAR